MPIGLGGSSIIAINFSHFEGEETARRLNRNSFSPAAVGSPPLSQVPIQVGRIKQEAAISSRYCSRQMIAPVCSAMDGCRRGKSDENEA